MNTETYNQLRHPFKTVYFSSRNIFRLFLFLILFTWAFPFLSTAQNTASLPKKDSYFCNFNDGLGNWFTEYKGPNKHFLTLTEDKSSPGNKFVVLLAEFDDISFCQSLDLMLFPTQKNRIVLSGKVKGLSGHEKMKISYMSMGHAPGCIHSAHTVATLPVSSNWKVFKVDLGKCAQYANFLQIRLSVAKDIKTKDKRQDLRLALDDLRVDGTQFKVNPAPVRKKVVHKRKIKPESQPSIPKNKKLTDKQIMIRLKYYCKTPEQIVQTVRELYKASSAKALYVPLTKFWRGSRFSKGTSYSKYEMLTALNPEWQIKLLSKMIDNKKLMRNRIKIDDAYYGIVKRALYYNGKIFLLLQKDGYMRIAKMDTKSGKIEILNQIKEKDSEFGYFHDTPQLCFFSISENNAYINTKKNEFYVLPLNGGAVKKLKNWPGRLISYVSAMGKRLYVIIDKKILMSSDFDGHNRKLLASIKRDSPTNELEKNVWHYGKLNKIISVPKENNLYILSGSGTVQLFKFTPTDNKFKRLKNFPFIDMTGDKNFFSEMFDNNLHISASGGWNSNCIIYDINNEKTTMHSRLWAKSLKQFSFKQDNIYYTCAPHSIGGSGTSSCSSIYNYQKPTKSPALYLPTAVAVYPHPNEKSFYLIGEDVIFKITPKK